MTTSLKAVLEGLKEPYLGERYNSAIDHCIAAVEAWCKDKETVEEVALAMCPWVEGDTKPQPYPPEEIWACLEDSSRQRNIERAQAALKVVGGE